MTREIPTKDGAGARGNAALPAGADGWWRSLWRRGRLSAEAAYFASKAVPGLVVFLGVGIQVRLLGEYDYGIASLYLGAALLAATALAGWLGQAQLRSAGEHRLLDVPGWVRLGTMAAAAPITLVVGGVFLDIPVGFGTVLAATALGVAAVAQSLSLFDVQAAGFPREYARMECLRAVLGGAVGIGLALIWPQPWSVLAGFAVGYAATVIPPRAARRHAPRPLTRKELGRWWSFGWPMGFWMLGSTLLSMAGRFVVAADRGPELAGYFSALYDVVVRGAAVLLFPLILAGHPRIMALWNGGDRAAAIRGCRALFRRLLVLSLVIFAGGAAVSPWVTTIVGLEPRPYDVLTVLLLLATALLWQLALAAHKPYELMHRTRRMLGGLVLAVGVDIGLLVALVPPAGAVGAAAASLAGVGTYLVACLPSWRTVSTEEARS